MKILIISDIHSNLPCLEAVLTAEADSDCVYAAGDLVDVGFYPQETIDLLRQRGIQSVRGNHDDNIIARYRSGPPAADAAWDWPTMNAQFLNEDAICYLESLPERLTFEADGVAYTLQHLFNDYEPIASIEQFHEFWANPEQMADKQLRKVVILGHTHIPSIEHLGDDCWVINPGSVGYNRPNDPSIATRYLTIVNGEVECKDLLHPHCLGRRQLGEEFQRRFGDQRGPRNGSDG